MKTITLAEAAELIRTTGKLARGVRITATAGPIEARHEWDDVRVLREHGISQWDKAYRYDARLRQEYVEYSAHTGFTASCQATEANELYLCQNRFVLSYRHDINRDRFIFEHAVGGYWFDQGHSMPAPEGFDYKLESGE